MQNKKSLSLQIAGAVALATLFVPSAFAESRHRGETSRSIAGHIQRGEGRSSSGSSAQRDRSFTRSERPAERPADRSTDRRSWRNDNTQRFESRNNVPRAESRNEWRGDNRSAWQSRTVTVDRFRSVEGWRPGMRAPYINHERVSSFGRVDRFERWHGGYRVWIGGGLYPIFVPFERWRLFPLRVGLSIRFGGYWDPLGYWSVYDYSPYDGYYDGGYYGGGYGNVYTRGEVRGVVESVDYRRGTLVLNDDVSRQFVTVLMPRDRRLDDLREGDYVEFSGDWTRGGVFNAYRLDRLDYDRSGRRY